MNELHDSHSWLNYHSNDVYKLFFRIGISVNLAFP